MLLRARGRLGRGHELLGARVRRLPGGRLGRFMSLLRVSIAGGRRERRRRSLQARKHRARRASRSGRLFLFRECAFRRLSWISRISLCSARRRAGVGSSFSRDGRITTFGTTRGARRNSRRGGAVPRLRARPRLLLQRAAAVGGRGLSRALAADTSGRGGLLRAGLGLPRAVFLPPVAVRPLRVPLQRARAVWLSELRSLELLGGRRALVALIALIALMALVAPAGRRRRSPAPGAGAGAGAGFF